MPVHPHFLSWLNSIPFFFCQSKSKLRIIYRAAAYGAFPKRKDSVEDEADKAEKVQMMNIITTDRPGSTTQNSTNVFMAFGHGSRLEKAKQERRRVKSFLVSSGHIYISMRHVCMYIWPRKCSDSERLRDRAHNLCCYTHARLFLVGSVKKCLALTRLAVRSPHCNMFCLWSVRQAITLHLQGAVAAGTTSCLESASITHASHAHGECMSR